MGDGLHPASGEHNGWGEGPELSSRLQEVYSCAALPSPGTCSGSDPYLPKGSLTMFVICNKASVAEVWRKSGLAAANGASRGG